VPMSPGSCARRPPSGLGWQVGAWPWQGVQNLRGLQSLRVAPSAKAEAVCPNAFLNTRGQLRTNRRRRLLWRLCSLNVSAVPPPGIVEGYYVVMPMIESSLHFRLAAMDDIPRIAPLVEASVRGLSAQDYSPSQIDQALGTWLGLDTQLIVDGTYFVVEPFGPPGMLAACGGWSRRRTPYGSDHRPGRDDALLDPGTEAAKIRAFFVHPGWARRGIGSRLLEMCEAAARAEGFTRCAMGATLPGVPLYRRHGYVEGERVELPLANGETLPIVKMEKGI